MQNGGGGSGLVVWPVFKTAMEAPPAAPVGSIPTRSRHPCHLLRGGLISFLIVFGGATQYLCAQAAPPSRPAVPPAQRPGAPPDTLQRQYISPLNAFWRSFLIPGWGQARLNRKLTGGIFVAWEGVTLGMSLKTRRELAYLRRNGSGRADDKRQEHEDWLVLLAFNHLFAGLEAYVSAHLADFPGDLRVEAVPGGVGAAVSLPIRLR
ncbi:MAG: hypothetical protein QOH59_2314 [Gemmatimonadales bacterium]|nr:hypothetical protein [Gemmatimonadales bacterium]